MSKASAANVVISASTDEIQLLHYLLAISSGISPGMLMANIAKLTDVKNSKKIGSLSIGASMNIKRVINDLKSKVAVTLSEEWMINQEINFTMFAMLGHIIFMLPDSDLTIHGVAAKKVYQKTIGGVLNITHFNDTSSLEGKEERAKILLKWSGQLKGFDVMKHKRVLSNKFPHLVKGSAFGFGNFFESIWSLITSPFELAYRLFWFLLSLVVPALKFGAALLVVYFATSMATKYMVPLSANYLANSIGIPPPASSTPFGLEALKEAGYAVPVFASRLVYSVPSYGIQVGRSLLSTTIYSLTTIPSILAAMSNAVNTRGGSVMSYASSDSVWSDAKGIAYTFYDMTPETTKTAVYVATGGEMKDMSLNDLKDAVTGLPEVLKEDLSWLVELVGSFMQEEDVALEQGLPTSEPSSVEVKQEASDKKKEPDPPKTSVKEKQKVGKAQK